MAEKVTVMVLVLKVDLACSCCYKKVKKVLCKFPQIRDQEYDVKQNRVTITVVCCNPEKMRDKLCCKGRKVIKSIEIKEPQKPKETENSKVTKKTEVIEKPPVEKPDFSSAEESPKVNTKKHTPELTPPQSPSTPTTAYPGGVCCGSCYEGYGGGPCYHGYGRLVPPPPRPCYDGYWYEYEYRYRYGYGYTENKNCCVNNYFIEENPQGCRIM